jgi:hypothetical protein
MGFACLFFWMPNRFAKVNRTPRQALPACLTWLCSILHPGQKKDPFRKGVVYTEKVSLVFGIVSGWLLREDPSVGHLYLLTYQVPEFTPEPTKAVSRHGDDDLFFRLGIFHHSISLVGLVPVNSS